MNEWVAVQAKIFSKDLVQFWHSISSSTFLKKSPILFYQAVYARYYIFVTIHHADISKDGLLDGIAVADGPAIVDHQHGVAELNEAINAMLEAGTNSIKLLLL